MSIKYYDTNGKYWGKFDETRGLFIPSEEVLADRKTEPQTERQRLEGKRWTDTLTAEEKKWPKHGVWELVPCTDISEFFEGVKNGCRFRCSNCKDERRRNKPDMNFCPNCGAKMKGVANDDRQGD